MASNRVSPHPQDYDRFSVSTEWDSRRSVSLHQEKDCGCCFRRRCFCVTGVVLLTLGAISAFITLGVLYGIPDNQNYITRECRAPSGQTGFLCDDRTTCVVASAVCDGKVDCANGEDESAKYCGSLPTSLPEGLVFQCANKKSWTYIDKLCNNNNDCGDCSDETAAHCPPCPGWRCNTVFFTDCDCIPKTRCHDNIQDCVDWSDEISCR